MGGRIVWSTVSDYLGRKVNYMIYLGVGMLLYIGIATVASSSTALFVLMVFVIVSFYGGGFSTVPAYLRDLFGTFQVGAIHGRLLTAWSTAGVLGPLIINGLLDNTGKSPGQLIGADYRPAMFIMVGVLLRRLRRQPADPAGGHALAGTRCRARRRRRRPAGLPSDYAPAGESLYDKQRPQN